MSSPAAKGFLVAANAAFVDEDYEQAIELYSQVAAALCGNHDRRLLQEVLVG